MDKPSILHIEFGGSYGGSTRALELYLKYADPGRLRHDVLFVRPTAGTEALGRHARRLDVLDPEPPSAAGRHPRAPAMIRPAHQALLRSAAWHDVIGLARLARSLPLVRRLRDAIAGGGYDVVHVNNTFTFQSASVVAARRAGVPVVAHVRNPVRERLFARRLARDVTALVSVNRRFVAELRARGVRCPLFTCYDGVEATRPNPHVVASLRRELAPRGQVLVASVGRLDTQKGYGVLLGSARLVADRRPDVRFVIAGDGPLRDPLQRRAVELGLEEAVVFLGHRSDAGAVIAAADLFVSSSLWEGLPLAVQEAMVLGKPVLATDVGGTAEIVRDGQTGRLVPPDDPAALAQAVCAMVADATLRDELGENGRQFIGAFTDMQALADRLDAVFVSAVNGGPGGLGP